MFYYILLGVHLLFQSVRKFSLGFLLREDFWGQAEAHTRAVQPGGATSGRGLSTAGRRDTKPGATVGMAPAAVARSLPAPGHCHSLNNKLSALQMYPQSH